jgi:hypothetical protein
MKTMKETSKGHVLWARSNGTTIARASGVIISTIAGPTEEVASTEMGAPSGIST